MQKNKLLIVAALLLAMFFSMQFLSELFFALAQNLEEPNKLKKIELSMIFFPLISTPFREAAFLKLTEGTRKKDEIAIQASIGYLKKALHKNPLDYQSHYYLAKAYLQFSSYSSDYFDLAVDELKRAARIRSSDKDIALDLGKVFFSLWPLLEEEDKIFTASMLGNVMSSFSWSEFSPLLEMWSLYVQDTPLLMTLLNKKPNFFGPSANQLVGAGIPLARRWNLLNLYEIYTLDALERRYNELSMQGQIGLDNAKSLLSRMRPLQGYFRLQPGSEFNQEKLAKLQCTLLLEVISDLMTTAKDKADPKIMLQIREYIYTYITDHSGITDLDNLQKLLEEKNYFKENDFSSLYLKTLIVFKKGSYGDIIAEIEALHKTISFVKKEQLADYTAILLLLVDSYYSSKLLTAAEAVANELYLNQPDNPEVLYRILRIKNILGTEGATDKILDDKLAVIANSRLLKISRLNNVSDVFLFNQPEIEINIDSALRSKLKPRQLMQVFVDNKIAFESYVDGLPEKIIIAPPFTGIERKVRVQVSILK